MTLADSLAEKEQRLKDKKNGVVKPSFKAIIDTYLEHREDLTPFKVHLKRNSFVGFHPSGLTEPCERKLAFGLLDERGLLRGDDDDNKKLNFPRMQLIFDTGHLLHCLIQYSYLPSVKGLKFSVEVSATGLQKTHLIGGTADILIRLQDGKRYIVDIKTAKSSSYYAYETVNDIPEEYIVQINLYMKALGLQHACFFFINKDNGETKEFFLKFDERKIADALKKARTARKFLQMEKNVEQLPECRKRSGAFKKCAFANMCSKVKKSHDLVKYVSADVLREEFA